MKELHWVLLRGLARETRHWGNFPKRLKKHYQGVTLLELPGIGRRSHEEAPTKIDDYVEVLREEYLKIKYPGPKALCAISMGGMIAQVWLSKYPKDFESTIIINSSGGKLSPFFHRITPIFLLILLHRKAYTCVT